MGAQIVPIPCVNSGNKKNKSVISMDDLMVTDGDEATKCTKVKTRQERISVCERCCGCRCGKGVGIAILAAGYFLLILPAGLLLCIWGTTRNYNVALAIGLSIIVVPALIVPTLYFGFRLSRQKRKDRRALYQIPEEV